MKQGLFYKNWFINIEENSVGQFDQTSYHPENFIASMAITRMLNLIISGL